MKPKNFPGRKAIRKLRANSDYIGRPLDIENMGGRNYTRDIKIRFGRKQRDLDGSMRPDARPLQKEKLRGTSE